MKKHLIVFLILVFLFAGCNTQKADTRSKQSRNYVSEATEAISIINDAETAENHADAEYIGPSCVRWKTVAEQNCASFSEDGSKCNQILTVRKKRCVEWQEVYRCGDEICEEQ